MCARARAHANDRIARVSVVRVRDAVSGVRHSLLLDSIAPRLPCWIKKKTGCFMIMRSADGRAATIQPLERANNYLAICARIIINFE